MEELEIPFVMHNVMDDWSLRAKKVKGKRGEFRDFR